MRRSLAIIALVAGCESSGAATEGSGRHSIPEPVAETAPVAAAPTAPPAADTAPVADTAPSEPEVEPEPEGPKAPEDYGLVKPPLPKPDPSTLTVFALAGYEVVAVHAKPDNESARLGYLRIGTRLKVTPKVEGTGCPKGWYGLPQGGFACASKGLQVDGTREPYMRAAPPAPALDQPLPYEYAYVRKWNSPMWWRVPTTEELVEAKSQRAVREALREGKPLPTDEPAAPTTPAAAQPASDLPPPPGGDKPQPAADPAAAKPDPKKPAGADAVVASTTAKPASPPPMPEPPPPEVKLPLNPQKPWLEKGYFISLADRFREEGATWWRTARGAYVQAAHAYKYKPKNFEGVPLGEEQTFPFGFVMAKEARAYELTPEGKLKVGKKVEKRTFVDLSEEIEVGGKAYMMATDGRLFRKKDLRLAQPQPLPEGIEPWERWVDVSLERQILVAYEGTKPAFVTLVSTGKKGSKEEPFDTPTGRWRIRSKHISTTMDGNSASDGNYSIQDVPWTMYFDGSYALHGAFWHASFGYVRSHGCVNLGPSDARWLFQWTTPFVPDGWHGVHAHDGSPGSTVIVRQ